MSMHLLQRTLHTPTCSTYSHVLTHEPTTACFSSRCWCGGSTPTWCWDGTCADKGWALLSSAPTRSRCHRHSCAAWGAPPACKGSTSAARTHGASARSRASTWWVESSSTCGAAHAASCSSARTRYRTSRTSCWACAAPTSPTATSPRGGTAASMPRLRRRASARRGRRARRARRAAARSATAARCECWGTICSGCS